VGHELVRSVRAIGGLIALQDLAEHTSSWVEPLSAQYRDVVVYELPPNSQGMVALMMLTMLRYLPEGPIRAGGAAYVHVLAEVARLAYSDREKYLTDPDHMVVEPAELLDEEYNRQRAALVRDEARAGTLASSRGDTIYLCTADGDGNLVSLIESNYMGIGSGVMAGETGIMLQNRGAWFSLDPNHANVIAPRKRTMHTLMPAMAFKDQRPWLVFGTMGASAQPQIHVQLLTHLLDQGMELDNALAAPRFDAVVGSDENGQPFIEVEAGFPAETIEELGRCGHAVKSIAPFTIGHAHAIQVSENGVYIGAADPRTDSLAMGY
jgi:gamma-glutamyltranspeptidase/glutathione hydrolase